MNISSQNKSLILKEIDFVLEKMAMTKDPLQRLYYFSGVHAVIQRVFNIEYDKDLVFTHMLLNDTYKALMGRLQPEQTSMIPLREEQFDRLEQLVQELAKNIKSNKKLYDTLREFSVLAYSTTGNGHYLFEKGQLEF